MNNQITTMAEADIADVRQRIADAMNGYSYAPSDLVYADWCQEHNTPDGMVSLYVTEDGLCMMSDAGSDSIHATLQDALDACDGAAGPTSEMIITAMRELC